MDNTLALLTAKDTKEAMAAFKELEAECRQTPVYADQLPAFLPGLTAESSCGRGRTFKFFMVNARWDTQEVINTNLTEILAVLNDAKAPVVRQCLPYLIDLAEAKPELIQKIREKIENLDLNQYKESMRSLIERDIKKISAEIVQHRK